jgi:hypothetical protein
MATLPLADPTVQNYRSGFLRRDSPHQAKNVGYAVATMDASLGWLRLTRSIMLPSAPPAHPPLL